MNFIVVSMFFIAELKISFHIAQSYNDSEPEQDLISVCQLIYMDGNVINLSDEEGREVGTERADDDFPSLLKNGKLAVFIALV